MEFARSLPGPSTPRVTPPPIAWGGGHRGGFGVELYVMQVSGHARGVHM